ncbi:uncharacterized protein BP5553_02384 [Venustampulla echinocandica]|uniref:Uncharacterized protein n=1 Tax=Venustampulla echinocandica TaxID=2656787 RepID=A0A370U3Q4_9HELO|nr:uncharacterized protein BP5553_02384 [Venustampulla echinocandica]RDL42405.1 hypothetical protein BP5553_02384 [Venustampulla echinocandica]
MASQGPISEVEALDDRLLNDIGIDQPSNPAHDVTSQSEQFLAPQPGSNYPLDYSDVPSTADSQDSSKQRRKHQRGGRKAKKQEVQPVSELDIPPKKNGETPEEEEQPKVTNPKLKHRGSDSPLETGIRAFSLKRAESSGGRPFGVSIERQGSKSRSKAKARQKSKCTACGRRPKHMPDLKNTRKDDWESDNTSEAEESEEEEEDQEEHQEEHQKDDGEKLPKKSKKKKPFAIRLDLNLELEIFLRAKIKGDVTITFL